MTDEAIEVNVTLTDEQRYAAIFALVEDVKTTAQATVEECERFVNAMVKSRYVAAADVVSNLRSAAALLPALNALVNSGLPKEQSA